MSLHPSVAAVRRGVRQALQSLPEGSKVMVACSGGPDSLALLSAAVFEGHKLGHEVLGATVDHQLQEGSSAVADRVVTQMSAMGADRTVRVNVEVEPGPLGPEAAARKVRYEVLEHVCNHEGADVVLLGHTRDDQAETVLLGLTRGSGGRSLAGMRRTFDKFVRPLLDVSRVDTTTACLMEGLEPWHDPHNEDPGYTRVRVRHTVLPVLEAELGPGVAAALARTADSLREDTEYLDAQAAKAWGRVGLGANTLVGPLVADLHPALRRRVIRLAAVKAGAIDAELFREHVLAVEALVLDWRGQKWIDLPGHLRAERQGPNLVFVAANPAGN